MPEKYSSVAEVKLSSIDVIVICKVVPHERTIFK